MYKAKLWDRVRSLHVPGLPERGWVEGVVFGFEMRSDGVLYVKIAGLDSRDQEGQEDVYYAPQNGTPTWWGDLCDGISLIAEASVSIHQKEKDGLGIVYAGEFYPWDFYGQTEKELIAKIKKEQV